MPSTPRRRPHPPSLRLGPSLSRLRERGFSVALVLALCALPARAEELSIGFVGSFSGAGSPVGRDAYEGFALALSSFSERFGGNEIVVRRADDRADPATARRQVEALLAEGVRLFVLASATPAANHQAADRASAAKAFTLAVSEGTQQLAGKGCNQFVFSLAPPAYAEHAAIAQYFANVGYGRMWLASSDTTASQQAVALFKAAYGGKIVGETVARPGQMSFAAELVPVEKAAAGVDGLYNLIDSGMGVNYVRQFGTRGLKLKVALFAPGSFLDQPYSAAIGEAAVDAIGAAPWVEDLDNPLNLRFATEFEAKLGRPASAYAAFGYDAAMLLESAFRVAAADQTTKDRQEALRNALRRAEFTSLRGYFRFLPNHFPAQNWYLTQVVRTAKGRIGNETRQVLLKEYRDPRANECPMRWEDPLAPPPVAKKDTRPAPSAAAPPRRSN